MMLTLYSIMGVMLFCACSLLAIPFIMQKNLLSKTFLGLLSFILIFSVGIYQISGNQNALLQWLTTGKKHYALLEQFEKLGGLNGAIRKIEVRLKSDPKDARGWVILGKLYLANNENKKALAAFNKAHDLEPHNTQTDELLIAAKSL